jgi:hypothetical protein
VRFYPIPWIGVTEAMPRQRWNYTAAGQVNVEFRPALQLPSLAGGALPNPMAIPLGLAMVGAVSSPTLSLSLSLSLSANCARRRHTPSANGSQSHRQSSRVLSSWRQGGVAETPTLAIWGEASASWASASEDCNYRVRISAHARRWTGIVADRMIAGLTVSRLRARWKGDWAAWIAGSTRAILAHAV